jgi:hypothetical protein
MTKNDLRVDQVWLRPDGSTVTVIHVAVAGCGDSVAWRDADGSAAGGSATEFVAQNVLQPAG